MYYKLVILTMGRSHFRYFVFASPQLTDIFFGPLVTKLVSPMLNGEQHPVECLKFWFDLKVKRVWDWVA